jgi:peptidyl-prolyl isomerase G (cyclophilin G)
MNSNKVFLDIVIGTTAIGRVIFELFTDITPKTAENFRGLCTGEYGYGRVNKKKLHYKGSRFHRIVEDQFIQGGDIVYGNGSGGESIYGEIFKDENFQRRHACAGLLSMANKGRNQNSSQFMITLKPCPHLDGKHVVFGQVIEGIEVVRQIAKVPTDANERPKIKVIIYDSGDLDTRRIHLIEDPFKETMAALYEDRVRNEKVKIMGPEEAEEYRKKKKPSAFDIIQNYSDEENLENKPSESEPEDEEQENVLANHESEEEQEEEVMNTIKEKMGLEGVKKFQELKAKINEVRNLNMKAVQEEHLKSQDPEWDKKQIREDYKRSRNELKEKMLQQGIPEDKFYSLQSINKSEIQNSKNEKKQKSATFGWDVFNTDSLFRSYKKRVKNMPFDKSLYDDQIKDPQIAEQVSDERKNLLNMDIEDQLLNRKRYSRRRAFYEDHDVTYINDRNMNFNKKLNRFFSKEAAEIKANLERGTAL